MSNDSENRALENLNKLLREIDCLRLRKSTMQECKNQVTDRILDLK